MLHPAEAACVELSGLTGQQGIERHYVCLGRQTEEVALPAPRGPLCVLLSPSPWPSAPLLWRAVLAFLGVLVPNHRPWPLDSMVARTLTHMIRCPDRTHMKEDTGTLMTPKRHQTLMHKTHVCVQVILMGDHRTHIASRAR